MVLRSILLILIALLMTETAKAQAPSRVSELSWTTLAPLPHIRGVAGAFAGTTGTAHEILVVAGGANFPDQPPWTGGTKAWHAATYTFREAAGTWSSSTPLPRPLGYGVSASYNGRVWCVGGGDAVGHVRSTLTLSWDDFTKSLKVETDALPPLPEAMALGSGVLVDSRLFIAGGQTRPTATEALGTLWSIDLAMPAKERQWTIHPAWPGPKRILPVMGTCRGKVILVSGAELKPVEAIGDHGQATGVTRRFLSDAYEFDPTAESWRRLADCPVPIVAAPSPAIPIDASQLAFLPGDDGSLFFRQKELAGNHPGFPRTIYIYDSLHDVWQTAGVIPDHVRPAVTTPTVAWRDGWIVPTGEVQPGVRSPQIVRITPAQNKTETPRR